MHVRIVHVHLAEARHSILDARFAKHAESAVILDVVIEGDFGARQEAHRNVGLADFGKTTRDRLYEIGRNELVRDLCRPRSDEMQTVVAHGRALLSRASPALLIPEPCSWAIVPVRDQPAATGPPCATCALATNPGA